MTLSAIGMIAVALLAYEWMKRAPVTVGEQPADETNPLAEPGTTGPPPVWMMVVFVILIAVSMLVMAWVWPE